MPNDQLNKNTAVLVYFSHDACNVCKLLKPKVEVLLAEQFPKMKMLYVNTHQQPEIAAQYKVFTAPTILIFFEGKEHFRFSRNVSIGQLREAIERPYSMLL